MKKQVLFIGNSYTYYRCMPEKIFAPLAAGEGCEMEITSVTHGGYKLHWSGDP